MVVRASLTSRGRGRNYSADEHCEGVQLLLKINSLSQAHTLRFSFEGFPELKKLFPPTTESIL
jgi:hypothetical protein